MKLKSFLLSLVFVSACPTVLAQPQYSLAACDSSASKKAVGDRIKLHPPKDAVVKKGRDVDYSEYAIRFGPKKAPVWLQGIYGPTATSGAVSPDWLWLSTEVTRRQWNFGDLKGVDAKGRLGNGNYWRYLGRYGESVRYYDVPADAAAYFDGILNNACFLDGRQRNRISNLGSYQRGHSIDCTQLQKRWRRRLSALSPEDKLRFMRELAGSETGLKCTVSEWFPYRECN